MSNEHDKIVLNAEKERLHDVIDACRYLLKVLAWRCPVCDAHNSHLGDYPACTNPTTETSRWCKAHERCVKFMIDTELVADTVLHFERRLEALRTSATTDLLALDPKQDETTSSE